MKNTSVKTGQAFKALALTLCVGVLPLVLGVVGCTSSTRYQQSTGEYMHDQKLSAHVMKALKADYKYKYDGVNGFVALQEQKDRAGELANKVEGVKEVQNNITVKE